MLTGRPGARSKSSGDDRLWRLIRNASNATQSVIINIENGEILAKITQAGGNDEVWYDTATHHYYLAARGTLDNTGKVTPMLGTVDAKASCSTATNPTSTSAHSVAAEKRSHHVFVPIGYVPGNAPGPTRPILARTMAASRSICRPR